MASSSHGFHKPVVPALPVPHITVVDPRNQFVMNPSGALSSQFTVNGDMLTCARLPAFSANGVSQALLAPELDLRLEVLHYRKASNAQKTGWHHPAHDPKAANTLYGEPVAPPLPRTRFRGLASWPVVTEWRVFNAQQTFIIGSLAQFFALQRVAYRDGAGADQQIDLYAPKWCSRLRIRTGRYGGRPFAYEHTYRPAYFAFRYSIANFEDARAQRIEGPLSPTLVMGHLKFPFNENADATVAYGKACADIASGFNNTDFNCWFATRLPS